VGQAHDQTAAESAIVVADRYQRSGLGSELLDRGH
jgi:hypothetical protein